MGRLPNDVRTHLIGSDEKKRALLGKLLLLKTDSGEILPTLSRGK